jgi:hypothetical protein
MLYRGPGFLAVVWFGSSPTLFAPSPSSRQLVSLSQSSRVSPVKLTDGRGEWVVEELNNTTVR